MNTIARKLVLSVLTVVLTVIALGTTTFAWFTLTNTSVVQPFTADITADTGIEMALGVPVAGEEDDLEWLTVLTAADVEQYIFDTYGAFTFNHVTTLDAVDYFTLGPTSLTGTTTGYLSIPLNFRSNSANQIQWTNVSLSSTEAPWQADISFVGAKGTSYTSGDSININAADSMRIAILGTVGGLSSVVGYENPDSITNVVLGGGVANPQDLSDGNSWTDPITSIVYAAGDNGAMNYYFAKTNMLPFGADAVSVLDTITSVAGSPAVTDLSASTTSGAAFYGTIIVRIWIEGWDANAYNSILSRAITASFQFTGATV